ncbi:OLC1v1005070C1 [Oldenlandia corymbosa var. corymbosa]|uniref:OLC1v1005070C1 n=1 Tax=Oldenlandia corymbosa var. corymbosa TaxID=529605 RepID=A0AAV1DG72_OLDCO|nr:OLC1v1005070C1 [Oldenlandia corymbosa var. corymbosa]
MAFECRKHTENRLTNSPADFSDCFANVQVDSKAINSTDRGKSAAIDTGKLRPRSKLNGKGGILSSTSQNLVLKSQNLVPATDLVSSFCQSITDLPQVLISEIFNCLDPKDLGIASCVSKFLYKLASEHHVWKKFYCERWGIPVAPCLGLQDADEKSWKDLFVEKEFRSRTFLGRFTSDMLCGHKDAVLTVSVLASKKLIFTSGYDQVVRMWNMEEGMFIASSRPLGCTIRAVAADTKLLVAGGTDGFIHGWKAEDGNPNLFDIKAQNQNLEFRIWEHEGAITCLALDFARIYSGSWDMTVRIWDRSNLKCLNVLVHCDWVWSLVPHENNLASSAGSDVYVWDSTSGIQLAAINNAHKGNAFSLARSHTGKLLFTGGEEGDIHMFEIASDESYDVRKIAKWRPHTGPVHSLAFEFPWLVAASSDGKVSLIDVRNLMRTNKDLSTGNSSEDVDLDEKSVEPPQRMLHGSDCTLFSLDIGPDRIVCGGEEGFVKIWNFTGALETEQRVRTLRGLRLENRMRRRKLQIDMNKKAGRSDQCSVAVKKNQTVADRNSWHNRRRVSGKVNA